MITPEMQDQLDTITAAHTRMDSYINLFKVEAQLGNWEEAEKFREKIHTMMEVHLDAAMRFWRCNMELKNKPKGDNAEITQ